MAYTDKVWKDSPDHTTPLSAAGLNDWEARIKAETDALSVLAVSKSGGSTIAPNVSTDGLTLTAPAYASDARSLLKLTDAAGTNGRLLQIEHYGAAGAYQNYGLELHNFQGANTAFVLHQYSNAQPGVVLDNTAGQAFIRLRNTENSTLSPGSYGTGMYFDLWGYMSSRTLNTGGMTSGSAVLTNSTTGAFSSTDVGKLISVTGAGVAGATLTTTIASYQSSSQVTLAVAASTTVSAATFTWSTTFADGAMTSGSAVLTAATSQPFAAADVGKSINVTGAGVAGALLSTTILSYQSASQVTLAVAASTTVSGSNFAYTQRSGVGQIAQIQKDLTFASWGPSNGWKFTSTLAEAPAVTVTQPAGGLSTAIALTVAQSSNAVALSVTQSSATYQGVVITTAGSGTGLQITQNGAGAPISTTQNGAASGPAFNQGAGGTGYYAFVVNGYTHGPNFNVSQNDGTGMIVTKSATGAGTVAWIRQLGTGLTLDVQVNNGSDAYTSAFQILASGQIKFARASLEATGAGSAALGSNCPAVTATGPYTWEKVTTSDGSQGYIPVWK